MARSMTSPAPAPPAPSTRSFAALRHPGFRAFFITYALSMCADNIEHVISYYIMFRKFQSPVLGGIAVVTHWLPFLFFAFYSGALADRFDPRRMIQIAMGLFIGVSITWAIIFVYDAAEVWHAVVLLTIHGIAGVLWQPASQLLLHDIVGPHELQSAVRLNSTARYLGLLVGPGIGAALMLAVGPTVGLLINAAIYLPLVLWLAFTKLGAPVARPKRPSGWAAIVGTLRAVRDNRAILLMIALAGASSFFIGGAYHAQMPGYARDLGQGDADFRYGLLLAADAAGALCAGLILEGRGLLPMRVRSAIILAGLWAVALVGFALSNNFALAVGLLFVVGFLELAFGAMAQTLVQVNAPPEIRGRVIGLFNMSALGLRTFAGFTIGFLGSVIGIHWSLAASALAVFVICGLLFMVPVRRAAV